MGSKVRECRALVAWPNGNYIRVWELNLLGMRDSCLDSGVEIFRF